jgi:hypothetical protein
VASVLVSEGQVALVTGKHRVRRLYGHYRADIPAFLAGAIGCTGSLQKAIAVAVQSDRQVTIERAFAANQPAIALEFRLKDERLVLYVSPRVYRPLVVVGSVAGRIATARIYLAALTPTRRAIVRHLLGQTGLLPQAAGRRAHQPASAVKHLARAPRVVASFPSSGSSPAEPVFRNEKVRTLHVATR